MKHLSDGPTSDVSEDHKRRVDSLQVSVIDASMFSTTDDVLRMHERHFNGDNESGVNCLLCASYFYHLSGKPGNVREFEICQGNVKDVVNSQGIIREMSGKIQ